MCLIRTLKKPLSLFDLQIKPELIKIDDTQKSLFKYKDISNTL